MSPFSEATRRANPNARITAGNSSEFTPSGLCVTMTIASDIPPATERSIPPCWTTSIWPRPATARTDAIGSIPDSDVPDTLDGAKIALTMKSRIVALPIVISPLETENLELFSPVFPASLRQPCLSMSVIRDLGVARCVECHFTNLDKCSQVVTGNNCASAS